MEQITTLAFMTVGRACGFAALAIFCVSVSFAFDPVMAARAAAILTTILTLILLIRARMALTRDHRKTELWIYLKKDFRPPAAVAQRMTGTVLRYTYLWFAMRASAIAAGLWAIAIVISLFR